MDRLSLELTTHIASFLERTEDQSHVPLGLCEKLPSKLPPFATISRAWQFAIERLTFRSICLHSNELDFFEALCTRHKHRRSALLQLDFCTALPPLAKGAASRAENDQERQSNDESFTQAVRALFELLKAWEDDGEDRAAPPLQLILSDPFVASRDSQVRRLDTDTESFHQQQLVNRNDVFAHRYDHSVVGLKPHVELPSLRRVARFQASADGLHTIDMGTVARIAASFSNLQSIRWNLDDNERRYVDRRRQYRNDLADVLASHRFLQLKDAWIDLLDSDVDPLSVSFRNFSQSQNLVSLTICGVVGPDVFWPTQVNDTLPPYWPNLEIFDVTFNIAAPSGDWCFQQDTDNPGDEQPVNEDVQEVGEDSDTSSSDYSDDSFFERRSDAADSYDSEREARRHGDRPIDFFRTIPNPLIMQPLWRPWLRLPLVCRGCVASRC
ncbi:hypothetical protein LTR50_004812 [Elasticomyces elasticus]|nr:hypothetical protein LTR50_004812 [Elasticomyces elasticus]